MKNSSKILIGVGLGILAGGAAGYYLNSAKGHKMQRRAKKQLKKINDDVQDSIKKQTDVISDKLATAATNAKSWVDEATNAVKSKVSQSASVAENAVDSAEDSIKKGADKARANIKSKANSIENS